MCCWASACCPEGEIFNSATNSCVACQNVTSAIKNGFTSSCFMCPNLVQVAAYGCAPTCSDPNAVLLDGVCRCPLDRPLLPENISEPRCQSCDYTKRTAWNAPYGFSFGIVPNGMFTGYYCNRRNGGGYSYYCEPGTVGLSRDQTITLADGTTYKETASYGSCKPCDEVDVSALQYQASCESCGGTWDGDSWDNGTCIP